MILCKHFISVMWMMMFSPTFLSLPCMCHAICCRRSLDWVLPCPGDDNPHSHFTSSDRGSPSIRATAYSYLHSAKEEGSPEARIQEDSEQLFLRVFLGFFLVFCLSIQTFPPLCLCLSQCIALMKFMKSCALSCT